MNKELTKLTFNRKHDVVAVFTRFPPEDCGQEIHRGAIFYKKLSKKCFPVLYWCAEDRERADVCLGDAWRS